ncbi:gp3 [Clostridium phage PhiS63]|uniref:gp3 n=1 Tax=Clostridium phage PhiS63 TaxID=1187894 RepID=UPI00025F7770|nr:gp3 [Clostridium phage PhiS63]AFJ96062.1 gp3 [Clostridium phage PhiS63]
MRSDKVKRRFKKIVNKFKEKLFIADLLIIISFFIFFFTTFSLNKYIAMYLLGFGIFILSYFIQKR